MLRLLLETLNSELEDELVMAGVSAEEAVETVAREWGLKFVAASPDEQCRIYWSRDQRCYVNCWLAGVLSDGVEPGGIGFDEQIEWWEDGNE